MTKHQNHSSYLRWLKVAFLLAALAGASGYRFRCWWMCTNQTAVQNDYVEQRDTCRNYAQAKIDFAVKSQPDPKDERTRKATLVSLFSECMEKHGWNIPDGKPQAQPGVPAPVVPPVDIAAQAADKEKEARKKMALSRSSECAFARQAADISSNAAARARACDIECAQRLKNAPDGPRPAACPSGPTPGLDVGRDTE